MTELKHIIVCLHCGKEFIPSMHNVNRGRGIYCSKSCGALAVAWHKYKGKRHNIVAQWKPEEYESLVKGK